MLAVWLLLLFAAAAEAKAEVMQKDQFGVERRGFQAPDRFRVPGSVSPASAGSGGGGGDGVILLSVVAVVGKEKQGRRLADTKFYWCDANETAEALRLPEDVRLCPQPIFVQNLPDRHQNIVAFRPPYGERVILAVQPARNNSTYFYRTRVVKRPGVGGASTPPSSTASPTVVDDFGISRRGFQAPERFLVPPRVSGEQAGRGALLFAVRQRPGLRGPQTDFFWCDANETAEALQRPEDISLCRQRLFSAGGQDGTHDIVEFRPPYGERVILAVQPARNNATYFYRTRVAEDDGRGATGVRLCAGHAQEFAAFNLRPRCHQHQWSGDAGRLQGAYQETRGHGVLFKPSVSVRQARAYYCSEMETQIKTTAWLLGARTSATHRRRRAVPPALCRRWAAQRNCSHGKLFARAKGVAHFWATLNAETYTYRYPGSQSYSIYNCLLEEGFVRTRPPYQSLVSSRLGRLPSGYRPGNGQRSAYVFGSGTLVWDRLADERLCPYTLHAHVRSLTKRASAEVISFISRDMLMIFSASPSHRFEPAGHDAACLRVPGHTARAKPPPEYYALSQDLVLAFVTSPLSASRSRRATTDTFQLAYAQRALADDLGRLKENLASAWCRAGQTRYDFALRDASMDASAVLSPAYGRPVKALPHGDVFAVMPCRTVSADRLALVPSLRTDYDPVLYRSLNIPVAARRCFSRPLVSFRENSHNLTVYAQVAPNRELTTLFPYTRACDSKQEFFFDLGGENLHHFFGDKLVRSYNKTRIADHAASAMCIANASAACRSAVPVWLRLVDTHTRLDQRMTEHLGLASVDPRVYSLAELRSYFHITDAGRAVAFLQAFKESMYHWANIGSRHFDGPPDVALVVETLAAGVAGVAAGLVEGAVQSVGNFLSWLFTDPIFRVFLLVAGVGGFLAWAELMFALVQTLCARRRSGPPGLVRPAEAQMSQQG